MVDTVRIQLKSEFLLFLGWLVFGADFQTNC
jgi:hypothetical protein